MGALGVGVSGLRGRHGVSMVLASQAARRTRGAVAHALFGRHLSGRCCGGPCARALARARARAGSALSGAGGAGVRTARGMGGRPYRPTALHRRVGVLTRSDTCAKLLNPKVAGNHIMHIRLLR